MTNSKLISSENFRWFVNQTLSAYYCPFADRSEMSLSDGYVIQLWDTQLSLNQIQNPNFNQEGKQTIAGALVKQLIEAWSLMGRDHESVPDWVQDIKPLKERIFLMPENLKVFYEDRPDDAWSQPLLEYNILGTKGLFTFI